MTDPGAAGDLLTGVFSLPFQAKDGPLQGHNLNLPADTTAVTLNGPTGCVTYDAGPLGRLWLYFMRYEKLDLPSGTGPTRVLRGGPNNGRTIDIDVDVVEVTYFHGPAREVYRVDPQDGGVLVYRGRIPSWGDELMPPEVAEAQDEIRRRRSEYHAAGINAAATQEWQLAALLRLRIFDALPKDLADLDETTAGDLRAVVDFEDGDVQQVLRGLLERSKLCEILLILGQPIPPLV